MNGSATQAAAVASPRFEPLLLVLAVALAGCVLLVSRPFMPMLLAFALAAGVLSFIPRRGRWLVFAAMLGMGTGNGAVLLFASGVFQNPLIAEFGWTRAQYFTAIQLAIPGTVLMSPVIGALLDRLGVRRVVLPSIFLLAATVGSLYFLTPHLWHFYTVFVLIPILGAGTSSAAYARLTTLWFSSHRGLALGAVLAGMGMGGAVLSPALQALQASHGWRIGFLGLAALLLAPLPIALRWLRDPPAGVAFPGDGDAEQKVANPASAPASQPPAEGYGLTMQQSTRTSRFWLLAITFLVLGFAVGGLMFQLFPILVARGLSAADAAGIAGSMGLALIAGRTFAGFLMDRLFAPYVAIAFLMGPIAGALLLAWGGAGPAAMLAGLLIGLAAGAEVDVLAYLVSRYFGTRAYATHYSWLYAAWATGSGLGPTLGARLYDHLGSYTLALFIYAGLFLLVCLLLTRLGRYPVWLREDPASGSRDNA